MKTFVLVPLALAALLFTKAAACPTTSRRTAVSGASSRVLLRELVASETVGLPRVSSCRVVSAKDVHGVRDGLEVIGSDAGAPEASRHPRAYVVEFEPLGHGAIRALVGPDVGLDLISIDAEHAVAVGVLRPDPLPAARITLKLADVAIEANARGLETVRDSAPVFAARRGVSRSKVHTALGRDLAAVAPSDPASLALVVVDRVAADHLQVPEAGACEVYELRAHDTLRDKSAPGPADRRAGSLTSRCGPCSREGAIRRLEVSKYTSFDAPKGRVS
jgi:hypothetical protein